MWKSKLPQQPWTIVLRVVAAVFFVGAGINHFVKPAFYQRLIPPGFPAPALLVVISGLAEMAGGIGLLIPPLRRMAGWGLIALLIAVFPANIYMAVAPERFSDMNISRWLLWLRLPLQGVMIGWVWAISQPRRRMRPASVVKDDAVE